jgi:glycosyltransferase involved in cell wall biosynthesis
MPKVSVIIPAYNTATYLAEAVESVLKQSFRGFEILIVDDGSTDDTLEVARRFEPQVRVFSKENGGPASARNLAINNSTGEYLAFLDSDDLWEEDKLAERDPWPSCVVPSSFPCPIRQRTPYVVAVAVRLSYRGRTGEADPSLTSAAARGGPAVPVAAAPPPRPLYWRACVAFVSVLSPSSPLPVPHPPLSPSSPLPVLHPQPIGCSKDSLWRSASRSASISAAEQ